ncbi:MAG: molecular chaperone DnaK [Bacteroidetes bacterium]|nr:MAG: molecular chaperone DnaK [Bacteroidota bacterium]
MKKSIGIDLGTTNSVIAFKDTAIKIIRNKENEELTRSCVGQRNGELLVGRSAYQLIERDPVNTILSVKRLMGAAIKDKMVQDMKNSKYYKFGISELKGGTDDAVTVVLGGKQFTPEQISAEILKKLKKDAEEKLGGEITHAVITVPAYFTEKQKNATHTAAILAGLKVKKLLAEPTAAAIAYGVDNLKAGEAKTILIYDFGGGTFDLSILNIADGQYMEAGTGGDRWLGGDDLDKKLQEIVEKKLSKQYNISNLHLLVESLNEKKRYRFEGQMRYQTEEAKIQLSSSNKAGILIDNLLEDENGDIIDIDITITREEFEEAIRPFVQRTIDLIEQLLKEVGYDIQMIDNILLVGGSSCIPLVKKMLSEKYGHSKIKISEKPMLAIAEGAGILAHRLGDTYEPGPDVTAEIEDISYSTTHNYYLEIQENEERKKELIVEKQATLPAEKIKVFNTLTANQKIARVAIYADVEDGKDELQLLGYYPIEENLPIDTELVFEFYLDLNEKFKINVYPRKDKSKSKEIILGRGGADQKALKTIDELVERAVQEFKTIEGEEELVQFITKKIAEINKIGSQNIDDNKWHEIYYTTTEKFDEIRANEVGSSDIEQELYRAKRLLIEFSELMETYDRNTLIQLITKIESSDNHAEQGELAKKMEEKTDEYEVLNAAIRIELLANRILELPVTGIGKSKKQEDVNRLLQIYTTSKTKFLMKQNEEASALVLEAYEIIKTYRQWL